MQLDTYGQALPGDTGVPLGFASSPNGLNSLLPFPCGASVIGQVASRLSDRMFGPLLHISLKCVIRYKKGLDIHSELLSSPRSIPIVVSGLCLPNPEHLGSACWAYTLSCRFAILHGDGPGILHFPFGTTFHTVCLHWSTSLFV